MAYLPGGVFIDPALEYTFGSRDVFSCLLYPP